MYGSSIYPAYHIWRRAASKLHDGGSQRSIERSKCPARPTSFISHRFRAARPVRISPPSYQEGNLSGKTSGTTGWSTGESAKLYPGISSGSGSHDKTSRPKTFILEFVAADSRGHGRQKLAVHRADDLTKHAAEQQDRELEGPSATGREVINGEKEFCGVRAPRDLSIQRRRILLGHLRRAIGLTKEIDCPK